MPGTECEVTVHFTPDFAREYLVHAWVELQGCSERLPISFHAQVREGERERLLRGARHTYANLCVAFAPVCSNAGPGPGRRVQL